MQEQGKRAAFDPGKTNVGMQYGQYNSFENDFALNLTQQFDFPTVYTNQRKLTKEKTEGHGAYYKEKMRCPCWQAVNKKKK